MQFQIEDILKEIGLSEKEIIIYLSLLKLGEETASRISEVADLNRVTTYGLLKSLMEKGFCSIYDKNKVQYFKPIKPEGILKLIEIKKEKFKSILPFLKHKEAKLDSKPEVSIFEGKKGIISALDIIIQDAKKKKEVFGYGNFVVANSLIEYESLNWRKTRIDNKIKIKAVINEVVPIEEYKSLKGYRELSDIKENKELEKIKSYTLISENYVGILFPSEELKGILIKSKEVVDKEKFNFEMLWKKAKVIK
jgi:HTH-type transcriptional regulator, sugar sensing transcriptional regulator